MSHEDRAPSRRRFLGDALTLAAGSVALAPSAVVGSRRAGDAGNAAVDDRRAPMTTRLPDLPSRVYVDHDGSGFGEAQRQGRRFTSAHGVVELVPAENGTSVKVSAPASTLHRVVLRWPTSFPATTVFLGDHWERSYGDLQWRSLQPERVMPWYFAAHDPASGRTFMAGVKTQPSSLCFWTVDAEGTSLWLDFRNGGSPSRPGDREIAAATIVTMDAPKRETPFAALRRFCGVMSPSPRLSSTPICGNNNWYYAYGRNFDANAMRRDAAFLAEISAGHAVRPYCVIDAGWTPGSGAPGGPWTKGDERIFPDMPGLATDMKKLGVRPGIWIRPTALSVVDDPKRLRSGPAHDEEKPLDLTMSENLQIIHDDVARMRTWGYELIKHDFSTYDAFGRWGFDMGAELTDSRWHFADQSLTNAEIILRLYRTLRAGAGDAVLLGCNTIGHLGAGLFEIQRTGDDTSGHAWERTRRMGVNTLAFRLPQNGTFFSGDPDCAAHTAQTPWAMDRQFLDLVAKSGEALFVSVDPRTVTREQKAAYRSAMLLALSGGEKGGVEPLDWLHSTAPREWRVGARRVTYRWEEGMGALPMRI